MILLYYSCGDAKKKYIYMIRFLWDELKKGEVDKAKDGSLLA
jgi:hypothetical protein